MDTRHWLRLFGFAAVWALAVATWASIAHQLFGFPDLGLPAVILSVAIIAAWPLRRRTSISL